ncbi:MAG: proline--tRNA ligase [Candidatus Parcubacteria bacterium]|nr:MAG: proline--tRNA ligase [Candidatus Parcubacteria bacterium]
MRQSILFYKTYKNLVSDEESLNAQLLIRAGFIEKVSSGIYNFLPLGFRVLEKIKEIIRNELNKIGCQELLLTNLHPKEYWQITGRLDKFDVLFFTKSQIGSEYILAPTHEEIIFPLVKKIVNSYKDLPLAVYQIHSKFRDELRAKAGLLRNREFIMKDLYSFHTDNKDLEKFKNLVDKTYLKIFKLCGLKAIPTLADGGSFSKFSTEFQVATQSGEDVIYYCDNCRKAWNKDIIKSKIKKCNLCKKNLDVIKSIEVGNTFNLGLKFSKDFNLIYLDKFNKKNYIWAGCYGIGISRLLGAIVEVNNDKNGIIWPINVAPFVIHLLLFQYSNQKINLQLIKLANKIYHFLTKNNFEVLFDDRLDVSNSQKLVESDLIGLPYKIIVGEKSLNNELELKLRKNNKIIKTNFNNLLKWLKL